MYTVPYFFLINMKSLGEEYYSENVIVSTLSLSPFLNCAGRIIGGIIISQYTLYKSN